MRGIALALLGAAVLGLSACGGETSRDDRTEIQATIEAAAASVDPAGCQRYATQKFLEQTYKERGEKALRSCEESAGEETPTPVTVMRVEVDGDEATAQVAYDGDSDYVGLVATLALVKRDGRWLEDEVTEFVEFDADALAMEWGRQMLRKADSGVNARASVCVVEQLYGLDEEQLEALLLDPSPQPWQELARPCEPRSDGV